MSSRDASSARAQGGRPDRLRSPREIIAELRRVTWPSREETTRLTIMVVVVSATIGLLLGALDYVFAILVNTVLIAP